ncbi:Dephospho-CoA kinase [Eubacterium plexicaudatum ASF492]|uniref:Dephospho-CoA kinase n=1 Tax=Eubacterium plexicaudatum ASF492 TaxID=1235802 RepID=N2AGS1_9FIRM|nr:Dephospho-CoA kinase [Eubacterium plexicaudatum ASF492]
MKFIGITGGVGAGKSTILAYLRKNYRVRTLVADEVAHDIMEPGYDCYVRLQKEFASEKIWLHNGRFNRQRLAEIIFADEEKRERLNNIVHPAVKEYILKEVEKERRSGSTDYVVLEAALLIEDGYGQICDELWYVYVTEENRRQRLIENRGYSDEKIEQIFAAQLTEGEYRRHCQVVIDNNGPIAQVYLQLAQLLNDKGERTMERAFGREDRQKEEELQYVFGLDIGTRNVVGTVGYKKDKEFIVVAQYAMEHETRAMLDGQIHDIGRVGRTISIIKEKLEDQIGQELTDVCIAAAGRVLKTVTTYVEYEFPEETVVTGEHIHTLDLLGVDKAAQELKDANDTKYKFYCVGYSVMKYYINDEIFSNLESHKADKISEKIIVTFLPEDVVDGLYMAVGFAGLTVANMTLEPIAAIDVAIPENFRMLNIALVDVGAGTSDISLTRDGSIIAYGMIPFAGDELTEMIVQHYLVDFKMAEHIKLSAAVDDEIEFEDIMSLKHTIKAEEVWKLTEPLVDKMTTEVAEKIRELNGEQSVSATFIVGGGGKIHGFDEMLAKKLELPQERVALRGEEVLKEVTFVQEDIAKDPLLVTPIGICLNYYEQKNNFIMVRFNGERLKLYDNNKLTIVDAAIQAGFPNDQLFPKRGREINFTVNGRPRIVRGDAGEAAIIRMNDRPASINTPIEPNCVITIEPSTAGREAHYLVGQLEEYHSSTITFEVNGKLITCPRYVEVNGVLEPPTYEIKEHDAIITRSFYTVAQLAEFMDVELDMQADILVNNRVEDLQALVYENFSVDWKVISYRSTPQDVYPDAPPRRLPDPAGKESVRQQERLAGPVSVAMLPQNDAPPAAVPAVEPQAAFSDMPAELPPLPELGDAEPVPADNTQQTETANAAANAEVLLNVVKDTLAGKSADAEYTGPVSAASPIQEEEPVSAQATETATEQSTPPVREAEEEPTCQVVVNGETIVLKHKKQYVFVDIFDYILFDLSQSRGRMLITKINGEDAQYTQLLQSGDKIDIYWKEN